MKKIYLSRKSYVKYDDEHFLLYTNEQRVDNFHPETPGSPDSSAEDSDAEDASKGVTAFSYDGPEPDGSIKITAKSATYDDFTAGLVRTRYSQNQVEAILANRGDGDKDHDAEFASYQEWRKQAKEIAKEILARDI